MHWLMYKHFNLSHPSDRGSAEKHILSYKIPPIPDTQEALKGPEARPVVTRLNDAALIDRSFSGQRCLDGHMQINM